MAAGGYSSSSSSDYDRRHKKSKNKNKKSKKKRSHKHHDVSDEEERRHRKKSKKHHKHLSSNRSSRDDKRRSSGSKYRDEEKKRKSLEVADKFCAAVFDLFESHPDTSESLLPELLHRLSSGTSFDLSSMPDPVLRSKLNTVFESLESYGMKCISGEGWKWLMYQQGYSDSVLIDLVNGLLDSAGLTMDAFKMHEKQQKEVKEKDKHSHSKDNLKYKRKDIELLYAPSLHSMIDLLKKFGGEGLTPDEVKGMLLLALEPDEHIVVSELENKYLQHSLMALFAFIGLEECDTEDGAKGYGLPTSSNCEPRKKLEKVIEACDTLHKYELKTGKLDLSIISSSLPPLPNHSSTFGIGAGESASSGDDESGPLPRAVAIRKATLSVAEVDKVAKLRQREIDIATGRIAPVEDESTKGREEWMMIPGEHDFLSSISKPEAMLKSRGFKNEKVRGQTVDNSTGSTINPELTKEMERLQQEHAEARGPSLVDLHREQKQAEKEAKMKGKDKNSWKWNRETDLDAGRRVDKDSLNMIMGGASENLKTKFQGSMSRSFM